MESMCSIRTLINDGIKYRINMQFLSRPPMSRKIRPPKVIEHTVFEIAPAVVVPEPVSEEPLFEEPTTLPVDISKHVMMDTFLEAIGQHVIEQMGVVHVPNMVDMQLHSVKGWVEPLKKEIRMDAMLQYIDKSDENVVQNVSRFALRQYREPPLLSILNHLHSVRYDTEPINRPISMWHSYKVDVQKLLNYFEHMKPSHVEQIYIDKIIQSIRPYIGSNVGPMLKSVEFTPNETEPIWRIIDMMKYSDIGCFQMINVLDSPLRVREELDRNMIYGIRSVDTHKINQFFCRTHSEYSNLETREIVMEMYSGHNGILTLLEKFNQYEISPDIERNDVNLFGITHSIKLMEMIELIDVYELLNDFADRSSEPSISLGKSTTMVHSLSNTLNETAPVVSEQSSCPKVDMVESMSITPLPFTPVELEPPLIPALMKIELNPAPIHFGFLPTKLQQPEDATPDEATPDEENVSIPLPEKQPMHFSFLPANANITENTTPKYPTQSVAHTEPHKQYVSISLPVKVPMKVPVKCIELEPETPPHIILSLSTTGIRALKFMEIVNRLEDTPGVYRVIINVCSRYKRFGICMSENELETIKTHPAIVQLNSAYSYDKYVVVVTEDFGPITKITGGMEYMINSQSIHHKLIVIDDDTIYENGCLALLEAQKKPNRIVSGSGFLFYDYLEYVMARTQPPIVPVDIVEGFAGICFEYADINKRLLRFIRYYRTIDWADNKNTKDKNTNEVNMFLKACFMGDDFIISYFYHHAAYQLLKVNGLLGSVKQIDFGFLTDALHRNSVFKSNIGTYIYIYQHIDLLDTFFLKIEVCRRILYNTSIYYNK